MQNGCWLSILQGAETESFLDFAGFNDTDARGNLPALLFEWDIFGDVGALPIHFFSYRAQRVRPALETRVEVLSLSLERLSESGGPERGVPNRLARRRARVCELLRERVKGLRSLSLSRLSPPTHLACV